MGKFLTLEEEYEYLDKIEAGDIEAKKEFISHYMPLVRNIASRYTKFNTYEDNIQEGVLGLYRALETFRREAPFGVYARFWVRAFIQQTVPPPEERYSYPEHQSGQGAYSIDDDLVVNEENNIIHDYLSSHSSELTEEEQELLTLVFVEKLTSQQIGVRLETSRQNIQQRTNTLFKKIGKRIRKLYKRGVHDVR